MKTQQRGWLERDRHTAKPIRLNPKRTDSSDEPIQGAEIWRTLTQRLRIDKRRTDRGSVLRSVENSPPLCSRRRAAGNLSDDIFGRDIRPISSFPIPCLLLQSRQ